MTTDSGKLALDIPQGRQASFDPQLIAKVQRRFPGFDEKIISMYARGMSTRETARHLADLSGIDVSPDLISAVTDAVLEEIATQAGPARWRRSIQSFGGTILHRRIVFFRLTLRRAAREDQGRSGSGRRQPTKPPGGRFRADRRRRRPGSQQGGPRRAWRKS